MAEINVDTKQLQRVAVELAEVSKKDVPKAVVAAINRTIQTVGTDMKREAVAGYEIKSGDVQKTLKLKRASASNMQAVASSVGKPLGLFHFKVRPRKQPKNPKKYIKVKIKKSDGFKEIKKSPRAFIANKNAANVFKRVGKNRLPIERLTTLSIPQMISRPAAIENIQRHAQETLQKRVDHEIEYRLSKVKGE